MKTTHSLIGVYLLLAIVVCLLSENTFAFSSKAVAKYEMSNTERKAMEKRFGIKNIVKPVTQVIKKVEHEVEKELKNVLKAIEGVGASCKYTRDDGLKRFECDVGFHQKFLIERVSISAGFYLEFNLNTEQVEMGIHAFGKTIAKVSFKFHIPDLCYDVVPTVGLCVGLNNVKFNKKNDCLAGQLALEIKALGQRLRVLHETVGFHASRC